MTKAAQVVTRYLGHSSWLWIGPAGTRVVIDPYDNTHRWNWPWFLRPFPALEADVVLVTHDHFDHNATWRVAGDPEIVRSAGEVQRDDLFIVGFEDQHASPEEMLNVIFAITACGIRFCHLGDNRADLPGATVEAIGPVDVLMVPVDDSSHLLRFWEVKRLIGMFEPRVVVPIHYLIPGLTDPGSTLLPADTWLGTQTLVKRVGTQIVYRDPDDLPREREVWVFDPSGPLVTEVL